MIPHWRFISTPLRFTTQFTNHLTECATILHASRCFSSWNPLKVFHTHRATFSLNNTSSQEKSKFLFFHTIFKHQTNTVYNIENCASTWLVFRVFREIWVCTFQPDDDLQFQITLPDHSPLLAFFQMWLHPRQHWQLWSNSFHGCRQERTHFCRQAASREAPGKNWHFIQPCSSLCWNWDMWSVTTWVLCSVGVSNSSWHTRHSAGTPGCCHRPGGGTVLLGAGP